MKTLIKSFCLMSLFALGVSCTDESLDPLNMANVGKGSILALRGTQLNNIYFTGLPGYEVFPRALDGTEVFEFDAEFLAEDPSTLESFDMFIIKRTKTGNVTTTQRLPLLNVSGSEFKKTDDYLRPWVSVSIDFDDILDVLGLDPASPTFADDFLDVYPTGISIESDLNLTDGSKVLASQLVAAGLYQSNQFYPAQKLNIAVTDYCPEDIAAEYSFSTTVTGVGAGGNIGGCVGAITGDGEFVGISRGKYSVSDATFGQYDCAWGDDPATGVTITNTCDLITTGGADQYDLIYTFSNILVSVDGTEMSFKWQNDYGDVGTTVLTRTDGGTWPTTLHD
jgi:hypothetical protein